MIGQNSINISMLQEKDLISEAQFYADFKIVPFVLAVMMLFSDFTTGWLGCIAVGFVSWTLFEYVFHLALHHVSKLKEVHDLHHDHPSAFTGPTSWGTISTYAPMFGVLAIALGLNAALGLMIGFMSGYYAFIYVHNAVHRKLIPASSYLYTLKMHHIAHHKFDNVNFGVITTLWDRVFSTHR
jgi:sterol desaturase/sphingolipid hydroxylase (fatty acid hydroxylase superfamily)